MSRTPFPLAGLSGAVATAAVVVVLVTASAWFGVLSPARGAAARAAEAQARLEAATAAEAAAAEQLDAAQRRERRLAEALGVGAEPGRIEQRNARLAGLLELAEGCGLEVLRLDPGPPVPHDTHAEVFIELEARGAWPAHHGFLGELDAGPADLSVRGFRLAGGGAEGLGGGYRLRWVVGAGPSDEADDAGRRP